MFNLPPTSAPARWRTWYARCTIRPATPDGLSLELRSNHFVKAAEIFVSVYIPDKLAEFHEFVEGLKLEETTD